MRSSMNRIIVFAVMFVLSFSVLALAGIKEPEFPGAEFEMTVDNYIAFDGEGLAVSIDNHGNVLLAGSFDTGSHSEMALIRYDYLGYYGDVFDVMFNDVGFTLQANAAGGTNINDFGNEMVIDGFGNIVVTGKSWNDSTYDMVLWRFKDDGTLDSVFNGVGFTVFDSGLYDEGSSIAIDGFGNIVVAGSSGDSMAVWRYRHDGTLDDSFNSSGYVTHTGTSGGALDSGSDVVIDSDENIIVAGYSDNGLDSDMAIWRFQQDGTPDSLFNGVGFSVYEGEGEDYGRAITLDAGGNILVAGSSDGLSSQDMALWRYRPDGTPDTLFNSVGFVIFNTVDNRNESASSMGFDYYGRIIVSGNISSRMALWRYWPDGRLDTIFNDSGYYIDNRYVSWSYGSDMTISYGNIYIAGTSDNKMSIWKITVSDAAPQTTSQGCFIATAAYGTGMSDDVLCLRAFRDAHLLTSAFGSELVAMYYRNSPPLADFIAERPALRGATRIALEPVVCFVHYPILILVLVFGAAGGISICLKGRFGKIMG